MRTTPAQKKFCYAVLSIVLFFSALTGIWAVDIGASGMVVNAAHDLNIQIGNGWFVRTPQQHYHIGLWLQGISALLMCILLFYIIINSEPKS